MALSTEEMKRALEALTPAERLAIKHKSDGKTRRLTAEAMDVGENYVKNLWQSVRRKLKHVGADYKSRMPASAGVVDE